MSHAIIRGANGRRHEVDFGDTPVRVEIYASEETVEIFIEADVETYAEERQSVGASLFSTFPAICSAKPPPPQHDVQQDRVLHPRCDEGSASRLAWELGAFIPDTEPATQNNPTPFPKKGTPELMERSTTP
jgi:hypothetical protein